MGKLPAAPDVYEWLRSRDLAKGRRKEIPPIVVVLSPFLFPCRRADGFMNSPLLCFSVSAFNDKKSRVFLLFFLFFTRIFLVRRLNLLKIYYPLQRKSNRLYEQHQDRTKRTNIPRFILFVSRTG